MRSSDLTALRSRFAVGCVMAILAVGCAHRPAVPAATVSRRPQTTESVLAPEVKQALESYIQEKYGWDRSRYVIDFQNVEESLEVYFIGHMEDRERIRMGGGKSFFLYFDPATLQVVREMHMQ